MSDTYGTIRKDLTFTEGEEKEDKAKKVVKEIMAESSPNLAKDTNQQI